MPVSNQNLISALAEIGGGGNFATSGHLPFRLHDIQVKGLGELSYPITRLQAEPLIALAHKAPYGKGSKTLLDQKVRSAWEIDADQVVFGKPKEWDKWLQEKILAKVKEDFGLVGAEIGTSLHKMLIYQEGDFFKWHKDSEKEKGMFGSLVLTLPSKFKGSALAVRLNGEERVFDLAPEAAEGNFTYTAFFADCDHEVRRLESGYRVSLVFNLLQKKAAKELSAKAFAAKAEAFAAKLAEWAKTMDEDYKVVLLEHQYTPENFSLEHLKLNDKPRTMAIMKAVEAAGMSCKLGLYTHYKQGELEVENPKKGRGWRSYNSYDDDYDEDYLTEHGTMGTDIYDESTYIENWADDERPSLGHIKVEDVNILNPVTINDDLEPIEKEAEGNMGNYGMTMEYWYHYGAVVLWKKSNELQMFAGFNNSVINEWLAYYLPRAKKDAGAKKYVETLLKSLQTKDKGEASEVVVKGLVLLNDKQLLSDSIGILHASFDNLSVDKLLKLFRCFPQPCFSPLVNKIGEDRELPKMSRLITMLGMAAMTSGCEAITQFHLKSLPPHLSDIGKRLTPKAGYQHRNSTGLSTQLFNAILVLGKFAGKSWSDQIFNALSANTDRLYINSVVCPGLLEFLSLESTPLYRALLDWAIEVIELHTSKEPQPRPDWSRPIPVVDTYHKKQWDILAKFMASPTEHEFFFREVQEHRTAMEAAIKHQQVDLRFQTLRKGSPHTLHIIKTNAEYELNHQHWKDDVVLLEKLRALL